MSMFFFQFLLPLLVLSTFAFLLSSVIVYQRKREKKSARAGDSFLGDLDPDFLRNHQQLESLRRASGGGSKYQNLYSMTVGIIGDQENLQIVGTGFWSGNKVIAIGRAVRISLLRDKNVRIYLPRGVQGPRQQDAVLINSIPEEDVLSDDSICYLEINEASPDQAFISEHSNISGHFCRIYGFTGNVYQPTKYIDGEILGLTSPPLEMGKFVDSCLSIKLDGEFCETMLGSGVLDLATNLIVGIVVS